MSFTGVELAYFMCSLHRLDPPLTPKENAHSSPPETLFPQDNGFSNGDYTPYSDNPDEEPSTNGELLLQQKQLMDGQSLYSMMYYAILKTTSETQTKTKYKP